MKKVLSLILSIIMLITMVMIAPVSVSAATNVTAAEAVQWVKNQNGKALDYDGYYGPQCVDLIMYYYKYLVGYNVSGNAVDYQWNNLPSGWWRSSQPEAGAVVVWGAGAYMGKSGHYADSNYGHVGIVTNVSGGTIDYYDQNSYQYGQTVGLHTGHAANSAATYIHPDFTPPSPYYPWENVYADGITETNAVLHARVNPMQPSTSIGVQVGTSVNGLSLWCEDVGNCNFIDAWFNLNEYGRTLTPGTKYYYRFFFYNGADYLKFSEIMSFSTPCNHTYTSSVTRAAACTEKGVRTYTCTKCGHMYTEEIPAIGHSWNQPVFTFSADGKSATAKRVCQNNPQHVEEANATVTSKVTKEPTTTSKGETTYTATAVFGGQTYTDSITIADIPETKPPVTAPDAPSVSLSNTADGLKASWSKVTNAKSYEVYYKASTDSSWTKATTTGTSYIITGAVSGKLYYVKAKSVGADGTKSDYSATKSMTYIAQANISSLTYNGSAVNAKWGKIGGATRYQVAYKKNGESSFTTKTVTTNTFALSNAASATSYTFKVRAQYVKDGSTTSGLWSAEKTVVTLAKPTVTAVRVSKDLTGIYTSWKAVSGATKYRVYYKLSTSSSWYIKVTSSLSYTIKNTPKGKVYNVKICAACDAGGGALSPVYSVAILDAPTVTAKVSKDKSGIYTTWKSVTDADKYVVYYRKSGDSAWTTHETANLTYTLKNLTAGATYQIKVAAMKGDGIGPFSEVASVVFK